MKGSFHNALTFAKNLSQIFTTWGLGLYILINAGKPKELFDVQFRNMKELVKHGGLALIT